MIKSDVGLAERTMYILNLNDKTATLETAGGKGASLARLAAEGLPVPDGFHVTTAAYREFVAANELAPVIQAVLDEIDPDRPTTFEVAAAAIWAAFDAAEIPPRVASAVVRAYGALPGANPAVAVRSSATAEDLPEASFAGQQETFLNVSSPDGLLVATKKCWASLWTARAIAYRLRRDIGPEQVALAVVVQLLVPAEAAGILFTANPLTGRRDEMVISAAWGLGEAVVGGLVTPDHLVIARNSLEVMQRETADKQVMTARVNGGTVEQDVPENLRKVPVLDDAAAAELAALGAEIEALYGMPMDVEWALADGAFAIVQARPVTALPTEQVRAVEAPESPATDEWPLPDPDGKYMRTSIIDFMPEPLSPLFATLGLRIYNRAIIDMLREVTDGKDAPFPAELVITIRDYAYLKSSFTGREWWALLSKLAPRLKGLISRGPGHFREVALPAYREKVARLDGKPLTDMAAEEIWHDVHALLGAAMTHLAVLQVDTLGAAAGSEGLFTNLYERFYADDDSPPAPTFLMGYDSAPIRAEKSLYDLAHWAAEQANLAAYVQGTEADVLAAQLEAEEAPSGVAESTWATWQARVAQHLETFGHSLYDLDFVEPVPAEDPGPALETVKMYMRGDGADPHARQARLEKERLAATEALMARARGLRGWAVRKAYGWASAVAAVREDSIASIGLAYPRLRMLLLELGRRLVEAGAVESPADVFWLEEAELEARLEVLESGQPLESLRAHVRERKSMRQIESQLTPPSQLPYAKRYMGMPVEMFLPSEGGEDEGRLTGVGASGGRVTGTAYVLHGPEDFDQMEPGGILVAKLTTPAWTPLFAMAGGVVTDIGGPLSHGSIVAREYGIPAVLGTGVATRRIQTGQQITVNGDTGAVTILPGQA